MSAAHTTYGGRVVQARLRRRVGAVVCALLLAMPAHASGQRLTGSVVEESSGAPIVLALVAVVDSGGTVLQQVLTNETGRFVMLPRGTGRVRLRIERIGYASSFEPFFELAPDTDRDFAIRVHVQPISLAAIEVTEERYCSVNASASETLHVWTEARKAFTAAALAERQRLFRFSGVTFRRETTEHGVVDVQRMQPFTGRYRQPFVSRSAADLVDHGYVRSDSTGLTFFAPDAEVLLSPEFERTNCFSLTRNRADPDLIGVRFAPNRNHVLPAVSGVAWLDARSAALRHLTFDYVNTSRLRYAHLASGRVEFQMLPNGGWIVSRWWIRMPSNVMVQGPRVTAVTFVEDGGEVRTATVGTVSWSILGAGTLTGVAVDSTTGHPLPDAGVTLAGTALRAHTDAQGFFRIGNLPAGTYTVALTHARFDSLPPYAAQSRTVEVTAGDTAHVALAIPPLERSALAPCLAEMTPESDRVALYGTLRDEATGDRVPHARLRFSWDSIVGASGQLLAAAHEMKVNTDERGRYIACDLPASMTIRVEHLDADRATFRMEIHTRTPTATIAGRSIMFQPLRTRRRAILRVPS